MTTISSVLAFYQEVQARKLSSHARSGLLTDRPSAQEILLPQLAEEYSCSMPPMRWGLDVRRWKLRCGARPRSGRPDRTDSLK